MTGALSLWLGERLLIGSIQAVVLVSLVWLACRLFRRVPAAAQAALWWLVALKLVLVFAPMPAVPVPVLPADFASQTERLIVQHTDQSLSGTPQGGALLTGTRQGGALRTGTPPGGAPRTKQTGALSTNVKPWFQGLILLWLGALVVQAGRLVLAHRHLRGVVARAVPWTDGEIAELSTRLGLKRAPQVRISEDIDSPQAFGLWAPVVLLPAEAMTVLSEDELTMTLCHELMHIRRRDLLLGWVPACAERLFFFHPLARLSAREYIAARESACDAAAVRALGVEAGDYGRMLVRLGIGNVRPALSVGGSPFSTSSLKRRLEMLETRRLSNLTRRWRWAIAILAAVLIPLQLVARTPEAPQISTPSVDVYQTLATPRPFVTVKGTVIATSPLNGNSAVELENAELQFEADGELFQVEAAKLKVEKLKAKIESERDQEREIQLKVAKLVAQTEENSASQAKVERAKLEEMMALIAKAREVARAQEADVRANADKATLVEQLARELQASAQQEARQVERQAREVTRAPQVTQQQRLQRLLEQLERLAAEQRRLLEEIRLLQQQPRE